MGLRTKFILFVTASIVIVASVVSMMFANREKKMLSAELTQRALSLAKNLSDASQLGVLTKDKETLTSLIEGARKEQDFFYLRFTDDQNDTIAEARSARVPVEFPPEEHLRRAVWVDEPYLEEIGLADKVIYSAAVPMLTYGEDLQPEDVLFGSIDDSQNALKVRKIGTVILHLSSERIDRLINQSRTIVFVLALGIVLLAIGAVSYLSRYIVRPIQELARIAALISDGNLEHEIPIRSSDEVGQLAGTFKQMVKSLKERKLLEETFGRYVSPQVATKVLKEMDSIKLGGENREVSVIFADIRNFTPFAETSPPEEVLSTLNAYFSCMIDTIFEFEGTLDKFIGDCMMAVFGAPLPQSNHAQHACACGYKMQRRLAHLISQRERENKKVLEVGIGINTGYVVAGNLGNEKRTEFSVVGDVVNLAFRISGIAKGRQILIGAQTFENAKSSITAYEPAKCSIKGRKEPIMVYDILGIHAT